MSTNSAYVVTLSTVIQYLSLTINITTLIIGTIGGICNLITFTAPQLRRNACVFYLLCTNVFQLLSILFIVPSSMATNNFKSNIERQSMVYCKFRYYLVVTLPQLATYYLLLSILDRCLATSHNVGARAWSQLKVAYRLSAAVLVATFISNIHLLVFYTIYNNNCQVIPGTISTLFISIYTLIVAIVLPYTLMFIFCIVTIFNMKRAKRRVLPAGHIQSHHSPVNRFEFHIIMVIILQVIVSELLLLLRIGSYVYSTLTSGNLNMTVEERAAEGFSLQLGVSLYYFSFAISFYVSTWNSKYFRDILWKRIIAFFHHYFR